MSFGYGVGDFLTVSGLAITVYTAYKDAPGDYKHISEEVRPLQTIVDQAVNYLTNTALSDSKRQEGKEALQSCQNVLEELNALIEKYKSLASTNNKMQVFKRVKLGTEDITTLRARLTSNTVLLSNFNRRSASPISTIQSHRYTVVNDVNISILGPIAANSLKWRRA